MPRYHGPPPSPSDSTDSDSSESEDELRIDVTLSETASRRNLMKTDVDYTTALQITAAACLAGAVVRKKPTNIRISGRRYTMKFENDKKDAIEELFEKGGEISQDKHSEEISNEARLLAYFILSE